MLEPVKKKYQEKKVIEDWDKIYKKGCLPWDSEKEENLLPDLIKSEKIKKGLTLDTGCGKGTDAIYLSRQGFRVIGLDISIYGLKLAQENTLNNNLKVIFCQGDALKLPFHDKSFDLVNDRGCFHHIKKENRIYYCREVYRVIKNDGKFLLRSFGEGYFKSGGTGQDLLKSDIKNLFTEFFEMGQITDYRGRGNKWPVDMCWCLMRKKR